MGDSALTTGAGELTDGGLDIDARVVLFIDVYGFDFAAMLFEGIFGENGEQYAEHYYFPSEKVKQELTGEGFDDDEGIIDVKEEIYASRQEAEKAASDYVSLSLSLMDHEALKHRCVYAVIPEMKILGRVPDTVESLRLKDAETRRSVTTEDVLQYTAKVTGKNEKAIVEEIQGQKKKTRKKMNQTTQLANYALLSEK
jgi:hypothetical protein